MPKGKLNTPKLNTCSQCKGTYVSTSSKASIYCSKLCRGRAYEAKMPYTERRLIHPKVCPVCGEAFFGRSKTTVYCSRQCFGKTRVLDRTDYDLVRKFGITRTEYEAMLEAQDGHCALCPATVNDPQNRKLSVDHDHTTKKVRGLLCHNCNTGLGQFKDDPARLRAAADYLEKSQ